MAEIDARLRDALGAVRDRMTPEERRQWDEDLLRGRAQLESGKVTMTPPSPSEIVPPQLLVAHAVLHGDSDALSDPFVQVLGDGQVRFADTTYDSTDPDWAYTYYAWDVTEGRQPSFPTAPAVIEVDDEITLALLGDWGGGNAASRAVAKAARALSPRYWVHLGDVYFAGTNYDGSFESDYQKENFLDVWPGALKFSFALNSNHDMYAHGVGYFETTLRSSVFAAQQQCSYFAIHNRHFRVIGLDTAYFCRDRSGSGFQSGTLGPTGKGTQADFLMNQAAAAAESGQYLVLLTHHGGLKVDGSAPTPLAHEVVGQIQAGGYSDNVTWYWGHEHVGAVYTDCTVDGISISGRCCGHGCIPWGIATALDNPQVTWLETHVKKPGPDYFVANGFATLEFDGSNHTERFFRDDGTQSWQSEPT